MFKSYFNKLKRKYVKFIAIIRSLNPHLLKIRGSKGIDYKKYLIVAGSARSGTTWVAELLNNIPNSVLIFEPLHPINNPKSKEAGFKWKTYLEPDEISPDYYKYFERLFRLSVLSKWDTRFIPLYKIFKVDYYVFKFIRANLLINWLSNNFPIKKPILILRHPCAVVSSRIKLSWKDSSYTNSKKFYNKYPLFKDIGVDLQTKEEIVALSWCEENYLPLLRNNTDSLIVVSFEGMVTNTERELKRIFESWNIVIPDNILEKVNIPSKTFKLNFDSKYLDDKNINSQKLLSRWKKDLSEEQIKRVLNIVKKAGMDFYTKELEPDYNRLYGKNPLKL